MSDLPAFAASPSVCIVLPLRYDDAVAFARPGGETPQDLHITLAHLGTVSELGPGVFGRVSSALVEWAEKNPPMLIPTTGIARFSGIDDLTDAIVVLVSSPALDALRASLCDLLAGCGATVSGTYGFNPHVTLQYGPRGFDPGVVAPARESVLCDHASLWAGPERLVYPLGPRGRSQSPVTQEEPIMEAPILTPAEGEPQQIPALASDKPAPAKLKRKEKRVASLRVDVTLDDGDGNETVRSTLTPEELGTPTVDPVPVALSAVVSPEEARVISDAVAPLIAPAVAAKAVPFDMGDNGALDLIDTEDYNRAHAIGRLRAFASADGTGDYAKMDWARFAHAFAWVDPDGAAAGNVSAFRLPHHDVVGGKLHVSKQGLLAAARTLMAGDSGIPSEDLPEVRGHLERHFAQFQMDAPWRVRSTEPTELRVTDLVTMDAASAPAQGLAPRVLSTSWIQVARVGEFRGHPMGAFAFTPETFATIVSNFLRTANRRVPVDYEHATEMVDESVFQHGAPAVGWIVELDNRGAEGLFGKVEWVDASALQYIRSGQYRFFSPAVAFNAIDPVTGKSQGATLVSGGLTNRPFLDGMAPVTARARGVSTMSAVGFKRYPLAKAEGWNGSTAEDNLRKWASSDGTGDSDTMDWGQYREGFAWVDPSAPESFGSYKLPHHDVEGGRLVTVKAGVEAAMAALNGARGGVAIPDADRAAVYDHLAKHYALWDGTPPALATLSAVTDDPMTVDVMEGGRAPTTSEDAPLVSCAAPEAEPEDAVANDGEAQVGTPAADGFARTPVTATASGDSPTTMTENAASPAPGTRNAALRVALTAAWDAPTKSASGMRLLSYYGGLDDLDSREDLVELLRYVLNLPRLAPEADVLKGLATLSEYLTTDNGASDGVETLEVMRQLRCILDLPAMTPALGVLAYILDALRQSPNTAAMTVSVDDVHIPTTDDLKTATETTEPTAMTATNVLPEIAAKIGLPATADGPTVLSALDQLNARLTTLSAVARTHAESAVDGLIAANRIVASARAGAVAACMNDHQGFLSMFPSTPAPVATPAPVPTRETPAGLGGAPYVAQTMSGASGQQHHAGAPAPVTALTGTPSGGQSLSQVVYARAQDMMKQDPTLSLRAAMDKAQTLLAR